VACGCFGRRRCVECRFGGCAVCPLFDLDLGISTGLVGVGGRLWTGVDDVVDSGGERAIEAKSEASSLSLRFPISSSKKDIVVIDAEEGDAEAVDRIGEMLDVIGDENSL
jgi:hypothetical protein